MVTPQIQCWHCADPIPANGELFCSDKCKDAYVVAGTLKEPFAPMYECNLCGTAIEAGSVTCFECSK